MYCLSTLRAKLSSLCIICSLGLVSKTFNGQVSNGNLLVPGKVSTFAISIPLYMRAHVLLNL